MLSRLVAEKGKPLSSFWDSYRTAVLYRDDFEAMYSCYFGCQAGAGTPEYKAWIQRYIEPNRNMNKKQVSRRDTCFFLASISHARGK